MVLVEEKLIRKEKKSSPLYEKKDKKFISVAVLYPIMRTKGGIKNWRKQ